MMKSSVVLLVLFFLHWQLYGQCNGNLDLCNKRYNEVSVVMTHNAYNYAGDFQLPNQNFNITQQLNGGVRGLMIDVHEDDNVVVVMHNYAFLGTQPLADILAEIKDFLDSNPNEIISIIFESYVSSADIETELTASGLIPYLHEQGKTDPWPTLQTMIDNNQRLVAFFESNNGLPTQSWYHYAWDYIVDTDYSNSNTDDFSCDFLRGDSSNALYLMNHWITSGLGTGIEDSATIVNANPYFINRAQQCQLETGKLPNFLGIDFYDKGDALETANLLNGIISKTKDVPHIEATIFPNPFTESAVIRFGEQLAPGSDILIYNNLGQLVRTMNLSSKSSIRILRGKLPKGLYFFNVSNETQVLGNGRFLVL